MKTLFSGWFGNRVARFLTISAAVAGALVAFVLTVESYSTDDLGRKMALALNFVEWSQRADDLVILKGLFEDLLISELSERNLSTERLGLIQLARKTVLDMKSPRQIKDIQFLLKQAQLDRQRTRGRLFRKWGLWKAQWKRAIGFKESSKPSTWIQRKGRSLSKEEIELLDNARLYEREWSLKEAADLYERLCSSSQNSEALVALRMSLAEVYLKAGRWQEARDAFEGLKKDFHGTLEASLAQTFLDRISESRKLASHRPRFVAKLGKLRGGVELQKFYFKLGLLDLRLWHLDEASESFLNVSEIVSGNVLAQKGSFYGGMVSKLRRNFEKAKAAFETLRLEFPGSEWSVHASYELADTLHDEGNYEGAAEIFLGMGRGFREKPVAALSQFRAGYIYFYDLLDPLRGTEAFEDLKKEFVGDELAHYAAIEVAPYVRDAIRDQAFLHLRTTTYEEAKRNFERALQINDRDAWARSGLGTTFLLMGDLNRALEEAKKAVEISPDEYTLGTLGFVYDLMGRYDEALSKYQKALAIEPNYLLVLYNMGRILVTLKEYGRAAEVYQKALAIKPDAAELHNNLGHVYWHLKKYSDAQEAFQKAVQLRPDYVEAHYNLGLAYEGDREYDLAITQFEKVLNLDPNFKDAELALARLTKKE